MARKTMFLLNSFAKLQREGGHQLLTSSVCSHTKETSLSLPDRSLLCNNQCRESLLKTGTLADFSSAGSYKQLLDSQAVSAEQRELLPLVWEMFLALASDCHPLAQSS